jgi:hypothetical protein
VKSWLLAASLVGVACHAKPGAKLAAATTQLTSSIQSCSYDLRLHESGRVKAAAQCKAQGSVKYRFAHPSLLASVRDAELDEAGEFLAEDGTFTYVVDLAELASRSASFDRAARVGASFMAPLSSVLVLPEPLLTTAVPVTVRVEAEAGVRVSVGLARGAAPNQYELMAHEIPVATYFAFGKLEQRELPLGDAKLEISKLDGPLDQSFEQLTAWIAKSGSAVRDFYGVFPVPRATVTVLPVPGRDGVVFGKVLPESSPGIALLVGQHASRQALDSDWILVHELFHTGSPSFYEEGKWLDEGLATYYEPIIRVRAGLYSEQQLWQEVAQAMPQGLPAFTEHGLEAADDFRGIYWGGALACLLADVEARKRELGKGLEVGIRALNQAGGNACEVWSLDDAIATIDRALGVPTLAPIAQQHAAKGAPFDFEGLLRDLGVVRLGGGNVRLSDQAPLAAVRRAITAKP